MVKVQRLDDATQNATTTDHAPASIAPQKPEPLPGSPDALSFALARGKGFAYFRMPTTAELIKTERKIGRLDALENAAQKADFFRHLARLCCTKWGDHEEMPPAEKIRSQEDEQALFLIAELFGQESGKVEDYCELIEGGHSTDQDFDAYQITLCDGTQIICNEPSQRDNQQRQKAPTSTEGTMRFAAALCTQWGHEKSQWSQTLDRLNQIALPDFFRISAALSSFRG
jgi:hypothetical protein